VRSQVFLGGLPYGNTVADANYAASFGYYHVTKPSSVIPMKIGTQTLRLISGCGAGGLSELFPSLAARDHSSTSSATCYYQEAHKMAKDLFNPGSSQGYEPS
jgi:hypothetical protein